MFEEASNNIQFCVKETENIPKIYEWKTNSIEQAQTRIDEAKAKEKTQFQQKQGLDFNFCISNIIVEPYNVILSHNALI